MLTEEHKQSLKGLSETCPAFDVFSHEILNDLGAALLAILSIENAESRVQEETLRARATQAISDAMRRFREVQ
jgi:hypothetical protein